MKNALDLKKTEEDIIHLIVENAKMETKANENAEKLEESSKKFLLKLVEIVDAFELLFDNIKPKEDSADKQTKIWLGNFRFIYKMTIRILEDYGVNQICSTSGKAIPGFHNIVSCEQREGLDNETIIDEIEKGYSWKNLVLRPASVTVVKNNGG